MSLNNTMLDYELNTKTKHTMIVANLTYLHYKMNILYEDYNGYFVKCTISTNVGDFYAGAEEKKHIKNAFKNLLEEHFERTYMGGRYQIPESIQKTIFAHKHLVS